MSESYCDYCGDRIDNFHSCIRDYEEDWIVSKLTNKVLNAITKYKVKNIKGKIRKFLAWSKSYHDEIPFELPDGGYYMFCNNEHYKLHIKRLKKELRKWHK